MNNYYQLMTSFTRREEMGKRVDFLAKSWTQTVVELSASGERVTTDVQELSWSALHVDNRFIMCTLCIPIFNMICESKYETKVPLTSFWRPYLPPLVFCHSSCPTVLYYSRWSSWPECPLNQTSRDRSPSPGEPALYSAQRTTPNRRRKSTRSDNS